EDSRSARLEEAGLAEVGLELALREQTRRRLEVGHSHGVVDDAGLGAHLEVAHAAEEVLRLPAADEVRLRLDRIELDASAEGDVVELRRFDLHRQRYDVVRWRGIGQLRDDLDRGEEAEIQNRLLRGLKGGGGEPLALLDVEGAPHRRFR